MLKVRSALVPAVQASSKIQQFLFYGFMFGLATSPFLGNMFMLALVITFGMTALFSIITLPVEYDASNRALAWLKNKHMVTQQEYAGAEDALKWAARTYLVAALGALANLLYWAYRILGRRD